jgi:uncharacterized membrane protein YkoI
MKRTAAAAICMASIGAAFADAPPDDAMPLSEIIRMVEQRPDFRYVKDVDLDDGRYEIEYVTRDGDEREIKVDPVSGTVTGD